MQNKITKIIKPGMHKDNQSAISFIRGIMESEFYGNITVKFEKGVVVFIDQNQGLKPPFK